MRLSSSKFIDIQGQIQYIFENYPRGKIAKSMQWWVCRSKQKITKQFVAAHVVYEKMYIEDNTTTLISAKC